MDSYKRFEEFLDKMRGLLDNAEKQGHIIIRVEDLRKALPELVESEDEKVRKELIGFIYDVYNKGSLILSDEHKDKWIAWLEKQGEQKLPIEKLPEEMKTIGESLGFTTQKECDEYNKMVSDLIMSDGNEIKPNFEVGDTIRLKNSTAEYTIESISDGCYHGKGWSLNIIDADKSGDYVLVEHKYTLSDEEEKARRALIEMVHDTIPAEFEKCNTTKVDCLVWLRKQGKQKSVGEEIVEALRTEYEKGRADAFAQMQKKWSEEDEKLTNRIEGWLDTLCDYLKDSSPEYIEDVKNIVKQLKSLKERYIWKPSDEQITVLELASKYERVFTPKQIDILIGLKEQLKKLKG